MPQQQGRGIARAVEAQGPRCAACVPRLQTATGLVHSPFPVTYSQSDGAAAPSCQALVRRHH
eukprot:5381098-Prymnesium_polylepis.3